MRPASKLELTSPRPVNPLICPHTSQLSLPEGGDGSSIQVVANKDQAAAAAEREEVDGALVVVIGGLGNVVSLYLPAAPAGFGAKMIENTRTCVKYMLNSSESSRDSDAGQKGGSVDAAHSGDASALLLPPLTCQPLSLLDDWSLRVAAAGMSGPPIGPAGTAQAAALEPSCGWPLSGRYCDACEEGLWKQPGPRLPLMTTGPCERVPVAWGRLMLVPADVNGSLAGCGGGDAAAANTSAAIEEAVAEEEEDDEYDDGDEEEPRQTNEATGLEGAVVMVERGGCSFVQKAIAMQVRATRFT